MKAECIKIKPCVWGIKIDNVIYKTSEKDYNRLTKHPELPPVKFIKICAIINNNKDGTLK